MIRKKKQAEQIRRVIANMIIDRFGVYAQTLQEIRFVDIQTDDANTVVYIRNNGSQAERAYKIEIKVTPINR